MTDLNERLRGIDRLTPPELWDEIVSRSMEAPSAQNRGLRHRVAAGLVAAVVSIAAFAFLVFVFRSEPDRGAVGTPVSPLTIRVWTTEEPGDLHISASFEGDEIDLDSIETPGPDLEYPNSDPVDLPVGAPIVIKAPDSISASVFELDPAEGEFVVENGSCLIPGSLQTVPGPGETAFLISVEGKGFTGGQAFRAETIGGDLDHDSAVDPSSTADAGKLGLATCEANPSLLVSSSGPSGDDALLTGTLTTENGCVALSTGPDSSVYVVWPAGYALDEGWLLDDSGNQLAKIGDPVQMGGGITNLAHAEPEVVGGIPPSCQADGPDAYWFAGTPEAVFPVTPLVEAEPVHIEGVPFDVCRPMSIPGKFIGGFDTIWVFERAPKQGCEGYEGFQYLGVGTSDTVAGLSNEIHDLGQNTTSLWPYAAFDIDRDGFDEIAVGIGGSEPHRRASIVLFRVGLLPGASDRIGIEQVTLSCGQICIQRIPWINLGQFQTVHLGAECEPYGSLKRGIVLWSVDQTAGGDPHLDARLWILDRSDLEATTETFQLEGEATASLPGGTIELCGSPVHWPSEFPSYPPEDIAS